MKLMAIDPGLKGGIVLLDEGKNLIRCSRLPYVMVTLGRGSRRKKKTHLDPQVIRSLLLEWKPDEVVIEQQYPMAKQGVVSTFSTAFGYGLLHGMMTVMELTPTIVRSQDWKPAMGLPPGAEKAESVRLARSIWPDWHDELQQDGPADAALLGLYRLRQIKGGLPDGKRSHHAARGGRSPLGLHQRL